jgi:hypothetical protein
MASGTAAPTAGGDALAAAHVRLLHDPGYQFSFAPRPPPPPPPDWLLPLIRALARLAPYLQWVFWGLLAIGVLAILALLAREFLLYRRPGKAALHTVNLGAEAWRPTAARAKALLADADRLAAEGRYDEAAHVLLFRSIDDIEEKRPRLVAPAYTSRDIAVLGELPDAAARALGVIVRHVERSLFGGRALDADAFADCRRAYEAFAFPSQWADR